MKKLGVILVALVLAVALGVVPAATVGAHVEGAPQTATLYAGQDMDVGDVKVWNDEDNIYVTYEITDLDWVITGTHLYVGKTNPDTLTTAPGQFPYDDSDADSVTDTMVSYVIPLADINSYHMQLNKKLKPTGVMVADGSLGVGPGDCIYIAAHAGVEKVEIETFTAQPELTWQRSAETENAIAHFPGYGGQWDPETDGFTIPLDEFQVVWDEGTYHIPPGTPSENFASWNYKGFVGTQGPSYDGAYGSDLRRFQAAFDMPSGCTVTGGELSAVAVEGIPINDNVYVFVNEDLIFWGGTRVYTGEMSNTFQGMLGMAAARGTTEPVETDRWYIPGTLPALTNLDSGTNYIDVFTEENERWGGMGELVLSLDCERTTTYTETAWGSGTDFEHPNWAMYFSYDIQGWGEVESLDITATSGVGATSQPLENGESYLFEVSGTFTYNTALDWADAEWYLKSGVIVKGDTEGSVPYVLDLSIDGYSINRDWGDYNSLHIYSMEWTGTGASVSFSIHDSNYTDNAGSLTVTIYKLY